MHATRPASLQLQLLLQGVRRPASPRSLHFALHPHPCRPPRFRMTRPHPHPFSARFRICNLRVAVVILGACMHATICARRP